MNKIIKIGAILLVLSGTGYGLYGAIQPSVIEKTAQKKVAATDHSKMDKMVTYVKPKVYVGTKSAITSYLGEIQTEKNGQIYAYRDGIIEAYLAQVGDSVKKGQVVARLLPAEFNPDLANMIAEKRSMLIKSQGMVKSATITLENTKKISSRTTESTENQLSATIREQDAKIAKMLESLAALDTQISVQQKTIENMTKKTVASVDLETTKLGLSTNNLKTSLKNSYNSLIRIFYNSNMNLNNAPNTLSNVYFGAKNTSVLNAFTNNMAILSVLSPKLEAMSSEESFAYAQNMTKAIDKALIVLDNTITSEMYSETMLNDDKKMLIMAKTDSMTGIQTILNMYEEQSGMLTKEKTMADTDVQTEKLMIEKMQAERRVMETDIAMAKAEKERMVAETTNMKTMSENETSKMETEAQKMLIDANADLQAANVSLGTLESAGFSNEVRAPFAGKITRRNINAGESIAMGTPLYDIVGSATKKEAPKTFVRFEIPETDLSDATIGKEVRFYRTAEPLRKLTAKIARVSPAVGSSSKGVIIEAEFAQNTKDISIGSTVRVEMEKAGNMLLIPSSSVAQSDSGDLSVFTIDNKGIIRSKPVSTERTVGLDVYVSSGILKDDKIIELPKNYAFLEDGIKVSPMEKPTVATPAGGAPSMPAGHH